MAADPRLDRPVDWVLAQQDAQGRWANRYPYAGKMVIDIDRPGLPSKWVTLRACRVLKAVAESRSQRSLTPGDFAVEQSSERVPACGSCARWETLPKFQRHSRSCSHVAPAAVHSARHRDHGHRGAAPVRYNVGPTAELQPQTQGHEPGVPSLIFGLLPNVAGDVKAPDGALSPTRQGDHGLAGESGDDYVNPSTALSELRRQAIIAGWYFNVSADPH